jgi:hypothetical protein
MYNQQATGSFRNSGTAGFQKSSLGSSSGAPAYQPVGYVKSMYKGGKRGQASQEAYQSPASAQARMEAANQAAFRPGFKSNSFNGTPTFNNSYRF